MIEIIHGHNNPPITVKIERRDFKSRQKNISFLFFSFIILFSIDPQSVQLPLHWTPMTKPWDRVFLGRRDNIAEWSMLF